MLSALAPAKINLALHITGQRDDGYHLLDSLIVFANVGDTVSVEQADKLALEIDGPYAHCLGVKQDNLALRAAQLLSAAVGKNSGALIQLTKNLPIGGGIGGGSADAAATLKLLQQLWEAQISNTALTELALQLGADVPVCLSETSAHVQGIGEQITPLNNIPQMHLVLVYPNIAVSSSGVYQRGITTYSSALPSYTEWQSVEKCITYLSSCTNDLTENAISIAPVIGGVLELISKQEDCLLARMSGSGSTCFGIFTTDDAAASATRNIQASHPDWWVKVAQLYNQ